MIAMIFLGQIGKYAWIGNDKYNFEDELISKHQVSELVRPFKQSRICLLPSTHFKSINVMSAWKKSSDVAVKEFETSSGDLLSFIARSDFIGWFVTCHYKKWFHWLICYLLLPEVISLVDLLPIIARSDFIGWFVICYCKKWFHCLICYLLLQDLIPVLQEVISLVDLLPVIPRSGSIGWFVTCYCKKWFHWLICYLLFQEVLSIVNLLPVIATSDFIGWFVTCYCKK